MLVCVADSGSKSFENPSKILFFLSHSHNLYCSSPLQMREDQRASKTNDRRHFYTAGAHVLFGAFRLMETITI